MKHIEDAEIVQPTNAVAEISLKDRALAELNKVDAGIADMKLKYGNKVYDCTTTAGMNEAKADRVAIREVRYKVPKITADVTKQLNQMKSDLKTESERITEELLIIEKISDDAIKAEELRKEREREEKAAADQKRKESIQAFIQPFRDAVAFATGKSSADIDELIKGISNVPIAADTFQELVDNAEAAKQAAIDGLTVLLVNTVAQENEAARILAERAELEELRAKQAAMQAELDQAREAEDKRAAAEREKLEQERRDHEAKMKAEQDAAQAEIDRQLAEIEEAQRIQRGKDEEAAAELNRIAAEKQAEEDRKAEESRLIREAEERKQREAAIAKAAEEEKARKAAEKSAKLLAAKCKDASTAFKKILDICHSNLSAGEMVEQIEVIAEANHG